ncbi:MAG: flagellar basal-body MS-ring/collar protein FliF [Pseudomonadota bacterium]|nr:flagellar M-ring protein FliF [Rhodospirillaceae bacterium]MEC7973762.1 flagellar basal-body MS-ring/collar protein FliF [Pseudomonadota bacterium]MEC9100928.1 flagellar basal-body MS-ring/collar protein FliF [Pseudomonadota bacterium]|tara:strand:- start:290 stop:1972 length:1683 start_codon:yes stop_codon:yes gene_type:complete
MNPIAELLRQLGPVRVAALAATGIAVLGFFIFLSSRLSSGGMALLYGDLDPQDSGQIIQTLQSKNIPYDIKAGGKQIFVPGDQVLQLRVSLAESGLPGGGSVGYEIFDSNQGIGTTNFVQNINLVRALEGELARTIGAMRNVRGARVHLVMPRRELFSREKQEASASVVLQVQGSARLGNEQVQAIQHLIAAAVPGMDPQKISVLDDRGQLLARGNGDSASAAAGTADEMRVGFENRMRQAIIELLERTVGLNRVRAEITAEIDYDRVVENAEIFDPDSQVARSTQTVQENENSSENDDQDTVTVQNNLPETEATAAGAGTSAASQVSRTEETVNFEITKTIRNRIKESGQIKRLSVAVLVDGKYVENNDGDKVWQPRAADELAQLETLVKSAVGFNEQRGDSVEIVNMQFVKLEPLEFDDGSLFLGISKEEFMQLAEILVLAVVGLLVILLVVRPVLTRLFESMPTALAGGPAGALGDQEGVALAQLTGPEATADMAELLEEDEEDEEDDSLLDQMIDINQVEGRVRASSLKQIGEIVDKHPEEAIAIVRNWMYQEGGT